MTAFVLKIIAAVTMLIDHTGLILFPQYTIFRVIGRLAFPIYAYCIAEGFRFTHNRLKYFLRIFVLGVICQIAYTVTSGDIYIGILLVFSMSIIIMALCDDAIKASHGEKSHICRLIERISGKKLSESTDNVLSTALACASVTAVYMLTSYVTVDYGFFGVMLPVCTSFFEDRKKRLVMFSACLIALCIEMTYSFTLQYFSLLAVPLIALYNGEKGRHSPKYFFYIFYPLHLLILYGISFLIGA